MRKNVGKKKKMVNQKMENGKCENAKTNQK